MCRVAKPADVSCGTQSFKDHGLCRSGSCYLCDLLTLTAYRAPCPCWPQTLQPVPPQRLCNRPSFSWEPRPLASSFNSLHISLQTSPPQWFCLPLYFNLQPHPKGHPISLSRFAPIYSTDHFLSLFSLLSLLIVDFHHQNGSSIRKEKFACLVCIGSQISDGHTVDAHKYLLNGFMNKLMN